MYANRANQTQAQIDVATTALDVAITTFKGNVIKMGDSTALVGAVTATITLYTNAKEGTAVDQYVVGASATLKAAIDAAQLVVANAANQTAQQLAEAKKALDAAVTVFNNSKVVALTGLKNLTIAGTEANSSNRITMEKDETLVLLSSDPQNTVVTVVGDASGTVIVTGVEKGGPITITVQVKKGGQVIKSGTFTVKVTPSITSEAITNLDFSTNLVKPAKLVSKSIVVSDFTGNRKDFTIKFNGDSIPIYIDSKLSTNFSAGVAMGNVVEEQLQRYYIEKLGDIALANRPVYSYGTMDTFEIGTSQLGSAASIAVEGKDWSYFFEQSSAQGTDEDKSKNRTFTISDGINTATIRLTAKYSTMDVFVNHINYLLTTDKVGVKAVKVSTTQFKLTANQETLIVGGVNKADFFK